MMFICKEWLWGAKFPGAGQGNQCLPFGVSVVAVCSLVVLLLHMLLLSFFSFPVCLAWDLSKAGCC